MSIIRLGSDWGGWKIEESLIRNDSYVISAGLAHDISFDLELMRLNSSIKIIGIDPTHISKRTIESLPPEFKDKYIFINKAIHGSKDRIEIGGPANSILTTENNCKSYDAINLNDLLNEYDISILKMDIEGSEYSVVESLEKINVDQICIEWHHWLGNSFKLIDTINSIEKIKSLGYKEVLRSTNEEYRVIQESLFIRNNLL